MVLLTLLAVLGCAASPAPRAPVAAPAAASVAPAAIGVARVHRAPPAEIPAYCGNLWGSLIEHDDRFYRVGYREPLDGPVHPEDAFERLVDAQLFPVAEHDGVPLTEFKLAYHELRASPRPERMFRRLVRDGTPAGKLFGLCGIAEFDLDLADRVAAAFSLREITIVYPEGCLGAHVPVSEILSERDTRALRPTPYGFRVDRTGP